MLVIRFDPCWILLYFSDSVKANSEPILRYIERMMSGSEPVDNKPEYKVMLDRLSLEIKGIISQNPDFLLGRLSDSHNQGFGPFNNFLYVLARELESEDGDTEWNGLIVTDLFWYLLDFISNQGHWETAIEEERTEIRERMLVSKK